MAPEGFTDLSKGSWVDALKRTGELRETEKLEDE